MTEKNENVVDVEEVKEPETKAEETTAMAKVAEAEPEAKSSFKNKAKAVAKPVAMFVGAIALGCFLGRSSANKKKKSNEETDEVVDVEPTTDSEETAE